MKKLPQLLAVLAMLAPAGALPSAAQSPVALRIGQPPLARELAGTDVHTYSIQATRNQFVRGTADQHTVDVVVKVIDPEGKELRTFDSPARGRELFEFITEQAGVYRIEVTPFERQSGRYSMSLEML